MIRLFCFSFVALCFYCDKTTAQFHITLQTKYNGVINISYALSQKQGFTVREKQAVLDIHNALRNYLALGKEKFTYGGPAPSASNMLAMEWDDRLAKLSQNWANNKCPDEHSYVKVTVGGYGKGAVAENICGSYAAIERDMYGEIRNFDYAKQECRPHTQCGHYVTLASWSYFRLGCGWNTCAPKNGITRKLSMVCLFAPMSTGGFEVAKRYRHQYEYYRGKPCSECPQGWNYCLGGGLCATKKQCDSDSSNKCVCLTKRSTCTSNGGTYDAAKCECKCPKTRFGLNCAKACKNTEGELFCGPSCANSVRELFLCPKACQGCGQSTSPIYKYFMEKHPTVNADHLKTTVNAPDPKVSKNPDMTKLPSYGKCTNKESNFVCENLRVRGYCRDIVWAVRWQYFCQLSCNSCGSTAWLDLIKERQSSVDKDEKLANTASNQGEVKETSNKIVDDSGWQEKGGSPQKDSANTIQDSGWQQKGGSPQKDSANTIQDSGWVSGNKDGNDNDLKDTDWKQSDGDTNWVSE